MTGPCCERSRTNSGSYASSDAGTTRRMWRRASISTGAWSLPEPSRATSWASRIVKNSWSRRFTWSERGCSSPREAGSSSLPRGSGPFPQPLAPDGSPRRPIYWSGKGTTHVPLMRGTRDHLGAGAGAGSGVPACPAPTFEETVERLGTAIRLLAPGADPLGARPGRAAAHLALDLASGSDHARPERAPHLVARPRRRHLRRRRPADGPDGDRGGVGRRRARPSITGWPWRRARRCWPPSGPPPPTSIASTSTPSG